MKKNIQFSGLFPEEKKKKPQQSQNETISDHLMIHPIPYADKSLVLPQPEESVLNQCGLNEPQQI